MQQFNREAEFRRRYADLSKVYWQHSIQLLPDLLAEGGKSVADLELERNILIDLLDFRGRSVIDIGSWTGYHAFEAKRAGAARVIATDKFAWNAPEWRGRETFELARDCLQLDVEMVEIDPTELPGILQPADIVLFLGVFYHMYQPVTILEKVCALAKDVIVIETQQDLLTINRPAMAFYPRDTLYGDTTNWWGPNPECIVELLETNDFPAVFYQERFAGGRGNYHAFRSKQIAHSYLRREADNLTLFDLRSRTGRSAIYGYKQTSSIRLPLRNSDSEHSRQTVEAPDESAGDLVISLPPEALRYRVTGSNVEEWFAKSGRLSVEDLKRALASVGRAFDEFIDVLDWGCGCGRILRHLPRPNAPRTLYGNDIDSDAITWLNEHLPWVETSLTNGLPPLPYPDNSFDLIFNHSVMSHLDENYQDAWLEELRRVLRPGGILTLTVSGPYAFQLFLDNIPQASHEHANFQYRLAHEGIIFTKAQEWLGIFPEFYQATFHSTEYIFSHWAKFMPIRSYIPRGSLGAMDLIVLEKPAEISDVGTSYQDFISGAPRQNLRSTDEAKQKETELLKLELQHSQVKQQELQNRLLLVHASRSWLITAPWRMAGRFLKRLALTGQSGKS